MAKQLNVALNIQANTQQAQIELKKLQQIFNEAIQAGANKSLENGMTQEIQQATVAANKLKVALNAAINTNTGNLDLSKFSQQLQKSNIDLKQYANQLINLGPIGEKAFLQMTNAIISAEIPMRRSSVLLTNLWTTMKNTMRWQLTSSALHGFMGALQGAYGYAQNLNESLNNIRIVTNQSVDDMARFAEQANKAAKALSATTTSYTDAALIYYQQGIRDQNEITARTDATIKLANVSRQSAEEVSSQMTAIWNNFADGSRSLEYYADVITALGAATASSSDEIAQGLQKFASIASTVGLSYEKASAALATVVAETRQSADVVGTAFRTMFARFQGLSLGKTLEDGVDLNKYSKALQTIGVNILDANGELKKMDDILDDTYERWTSISEAQKVALAETVAGTRQYAQFMAIMNNYDKIQVNQGLAAGSKGTLQEQADIYAESWEAARGRVRAAAEGIYQSLLDDKFFIAFDNALTGILSGLDKFIDTLGGVPGVLTLVGTVITAVFGNQMTASFERTIQNLKIFTGLARSEAEEVWDSAMKAVQQMSNESDEGSSSRQETDVLKETLILKKELRERSEELTTEEQAELEGLIAITQQYGDMAVAAKKAQETAEDALDKLVIDSRAKASQGLLDMGFSAEETKELIKDYLESYDQFVTEVKNTPDAIEDLAIGFAEANQDMGITVPTAMKLAQAILEIENRTKQADLATENYEKQLAEIEEQMKKVSVQSVSKTLAQSITASFQGLSQLSMGVMSLKGAIDVLNNTDMPFGEKFLSIITSLGMAIPSIASGLSNLQNVTKLFSKETKQSVKILSFKLLGLEANDVLNKKLTWSTIQMAAKEKLETAAREGQNLALIKQIALQSVLNLSLGQFLAMILLVVAALAGLTIGVIALVNAYNADVTAAKKAAEAAKELAEAAQEAKDKLADIQNTINSYKSAVEKLEECTKGTKEWNEALAEVHAQVETLLQKYPELLNEANLFNKDGTLNVEVLDKFEQQASIAAATADAAVLQGQVDAAQAQMKSNTTDARRKYEGYNEYGPYNLGYTNGQFSTVQNDLEKVLNAYKTAGSQALNLKDIYDALGSEMGDNAVIAEDYAKALQNLAQENIDAQNAVDNAAKMAIDKWATATGTELEAGQDVLMTQAYNQAYNDFADEIKKANKENAKSDNKDYSTLGAAFDNTTFKGMSITEAFNAARGTSYSLARNGVRGTNSNRSYVYLENGEEQEYKLEEMQATIAAAAALQQMGTAADQVARQLAAMDNATKEFLGSGSLEGLTQGEFKAYRKTLGLEEGKEVTADDAKRLLINEGIDKILAEQLKYDFANNLNIDWTSLQAEFSNLGIDKILSEEITNGLSLANAEGLIATIQKMNLGPIGRQAGDTFVTGLNEVLKSIDVDKQQEAFSSLLNINWSNWNAGQEAEQIIKDFGGSLENVNWEKFINDMRTVNFSFPDFAFLRDSITEVSQVLNNLDFGKAISDEDYNQLITYKDAWKDLFVTQADGSHMFIGNEQQMKQAIVDDLAEQKEQLDARAAAVKKLQDADWYYGDNTKEKIDWGNVHPDSANAERIINLWNSDSGRDLLENLNYTQERIDNFANAAPEEIEAAYQAIAAAMNTDYNFESGQWDEMRASVASNFAELLEIAGKIAQDAFEKRMSEMASKVANTATSLEQLQTGLGQLGGTFDFGEGDNAFYDEYAQGLQNIATKYATCADASTAYQNALNALNNATEENRTALEEAVKQTEDHLEVMISAEEAAAKYDLEAESLTTQMHEIAREEKVSEKNSLAMAIANQRMNKGIAVLNKNWKDWKKTLTSTEKTSQDYADTLVDLSDAVTDLIGWYEDLNLDSKFVEKNMDLIDKASKGDVQSILELGAAVSQLEIQNAKLNTTLAEGAASDGSLNAFQQWGDQADVAAEKFAKLQSKLSDTFGTLKTELANVTPGMPLTERMLGCTPEEFVEQLNAYAAATGMTAAQMQSMLSSIGVTANVQTDYQEQEVIVPTYDEYSQVVNSGEQTFSVPDGNGGWENYGAPTWHRRTFTVPGKPIKTQGFVEVASISMKDNNGKDTPPQFTGKQAPAPSATGGGSSGGGGKSSTTPTRKAASHEHSVNRYSREENQAEGLASAYDRIATAKDHAFGAERIRLMEKELGALGKLKNAASDYLEAIVGKGNTDKIVQAVYSGKNIGRMIANGEFGGTVAADYASIFGGKDASGKGLEYSIKDSVGNEILQEVEYSLDEFNRLFDQNLNIQLDSFGNINNRDELLNTIQNLSNAEEDRFAAFAEPTAAQENEHNMRVAYLEALQERIEQYGETAKLIQEKTDEYLDKIYEMQQVNADIISHKLEVQNELTERGLKQIENAAKLLGNRIYKETEAMSKWFSQNTEERRSLQKERADFAAGRVTDTMSRWDLWRQNELDRNAINSEQAIELLDASKEQVQAAFDDIFDEIAEMESFFGDTLDYWNEKIEKVTASMEANANTLEHLQNVLSLLGKNTDYKAIGTVLKGQLNVAQDNYNVARDRAANSEQVYRETLAHYQGLSGENAEWYKENVLDKMETQWREDIASKEAALEQVLEKVNAWFENEVNRIYQESENRLTGKWGSFDALDAAMERQHNIAEEYLTKTNQLYETNTLLRKLSQDIDKTDSSAAKKKLKSFSDEITAMKEQNQLSKAELDIAKARYELLLAEIALEEAQNAKSTVRLQRDNEGNYGYVYTADQEKVNDAEQNFADKQNDLYNLVLGQTQDYTEKIIQYTQERNEALAELDRQYQNGEIASLEEYNTLKENIINRYNELIRTDYDNYYRALGWLNQVGAEGQTEAWTNSFNDILYSQDEYSEQILAETDNITQETDTMMSWLNDERDYYTEEAKVGNEALKDTVNDITQANQELADSLTNEDGLIQSMTDATSAAAILTEEFARQYEALLNEAAGYEELIKQIDDYYATIAAYEKAEQVSEESAITNSIEQDSSPVSTSSTSSSSNTGKPAWDRIVKASNKINAGAWGNGLTNRVSKGETEGFTEEEVRLGQELINYIYPLNKHGKDYALKEAKKLMGYDTGGYTGEWGNTGKLAFLHEKELVLNSSDTQNLLDAVALIRQINSAIDLRAAAGFMGNMLQSPGYSTQGQVIEQEVTIHAEFPNATDHTEIEQAFDNLINRASQYANRG